MATKVRDLTWNQKFIIGTNDYIMGTETHQRCDIFMVYSVEDARLIMISGQVEVQQFPLWIQNELVAYREERVPPSDMVTCVLNNDLAGYMRICDEIAMEALPNIARWCYQNLPSIAWGNPTVVQNWLNGDEDGDS